MFESGCNIWLKAGAYEVNMILVFNGLRHTWESRHGKFFLIFIILLHNLWLFELDNILKSVDLEFVNVALTILAVTLKSMLDVLTHFGQI